MNDTDDLHAFVSMSGWNGESLDFTVYFDSESAPSAKSEQTAVTRSHAAFKNNKKYTHTLILHPLSILHQPAHIVCENK